MDKRDYVIIGLLIIIIAMLSYGVVTVYKSSEPVKIEFSDYIVTAPAGSHYHDTGRDVSFYLNENDSFPVLGILEYKNVSHEDFDMLYNSLKNGSLSKSDMLNGLSQTDGIDGNFSISDINAGDFNGMPEMSMVMEDKDTSQKYLSHIVKHNNGKTYLIIENMANPIGKQMYNTLYFK